MKPWSTLSIVLILLVFAALPARAGDSEFLKAFNKAYSSGLGGESVVKKDRVKAAAEIKRLIEESKRPGITAAERDKKLIIAEYLARAYKNVTDDITYLVEVKRRAFDLTLHAPVLGQGKDKVHIVDMPAATETEKNVYRPDNIVIQTGDTVRWTNSKEAKHVFASLPLLGKSIPFPTEIKPGDTWEYLFKEPGQYYYFCFIHRSMVGKVTVMGGSVE
ncbi:MAG: plastocyanin/azurin family copper-binding protein [Thermodesulfobacteriota bacterium]